jgi:hypothetical protein
MDNLSDILAGRELNEPAEVQIIKKYIKEKFNSGSKVTIKPSQIVIGVASAALAGSLRHYLIEIQKLCQTDKKLIIRIDSN